MHLYLLGIATIQVKHILLDALKLLMADVKRKFEIQEYRGFDILGFHSELCYFSFLYSKQ